MIVRIKTMGTRSTNTEARVDNKQKQHTDLHESCMQGRVNFKCWTVKKRNFQ